MSSAQAFAPMAFSPDVQEELELLSEYDEVLYKRSEDKMTRKRLLYDQLLRRRSKKLS